MEIIMAGHSKWAQIKHQKGVTDQKRGALFSKLLKSVSVAARSGQNPQFNPQLRAAIEKAKANNVPNENIERAVRKAPEGGAALEELLLEAYGPGGAALLIEVVTDSRNRTIAEIKSVLGEHNGKWADSGSVRWAFEKQLTPESGIAWCMKFPHEIGAPDKQKLDLLIVALEEHDDVQRVYTNTP